MSWIDRMTAEATRGSARQAVRIAWREVNRAVRIDDREMLVAARAVALSLAVNADARTAMEATQLRMFCDACLNSPDGLRSPTAFARLIDRRP